jgi:EAL domain-containing protein (putative c-di-GMP-specific phosphodiesterase class I)
MAHAMGLKVLAEGVETVAQRNLRQHHCDEAQGFLYARPMPAALFRQFLATASVRPALAP